MSKRDFKADYYRMVRIVETSTDEIYDLRAQVKRLQSEVTNRDMEICALETELAQRAADSRITAERLHASTLTLAQWPDRAIRSME